MAGLDETKKLVFFLGGDRACLVFVGQLLHAPLIFPAETEPQDITSQARSQLLGAIRQDPAKDSGFTG